MPYALIVTAVRTPIGRAAKGSLCDVRPDDLAAGIRAAVAASGLDPGLLADHVLGTAYPEGKQARTSPAAPGCWRGFPSACRVPPLTGSVSPACRRSG